MSEGMQPITFAESIVEAAKSLFTSAKGAASEASSTTTFLAPIIAPFLTTFLSIRRLQRATPAKMAFLVLVLLAVVWRWWAGRRKNAALIDSARRRLIGDRTPNRSPAAVSPNDPGVYLFRNREYLEVRASPDHKDKDEFDHELHCERLLREFTDRELQDEVAKK